MKSLFWGIQFYEFLQMHKVGSCSLLYRQYADQFQHLNTCPVPPLLSLWTTDLFSMLKIFVFSRMSCRWVKTVGSLLGMASFTQHNMFEVVFFLCCHEYQQLTYFLLLSTVSFCVFAIICLSIPQVRDLWVVPSVC